MKFAARAFDYSTSTGTGDFVLDETPDAGYHDLSYAIGAALGNPAAADAIIQYTIEAVDGSGVPTGEWETGTGLFDVATVSIRRDNPMQSSAGFKTSVNFSAGTKKVFITPHHEFFEQATLGFQYAMARGFALP